MEKLPCKKGRKARHIRQNSTSPLAVNIFMNSKKFTLGSDKVLKCVQFMKYTLSKTNN